MVQNICAGLVQADPQNRRYYEDNRDSYLKELGDLDAEMAALLKDTGNRSFVVYHPAWGYFARDYGLHQLGIEQEGKEPKAAYMARLIDEARRQNIKVIFVSPEFDSRNAEAIAREIGGRVVIIDPLAGDYLTNMRQVAAAFKEALK
jgi:zinc transport system substrate-binding protein